VSAAAILRTVLAVLVAAAGAVGDPARAQSFPSRPVRIIVPFSAGGSVDGVMRLLDNRMTELTGQNIIIDNRPGASGNVGTNLAARAAPDGHTVLATTLSLVVNPNLFNDPGHDVLRDFAPVSLLAAAPFVMAVHPSLQPASVKELIAYARVRPGELNYSSAGSGTNPYIAAELFKNQAKVDIIHVSYKGAGLALAALLGGETQVSFIGVMVAVAYANTGRMRMLGVTGRKRARALADLPTLAESGLPGYEFTSWYGVLAPRATPHDKVVALNGHFRNALLVPDTAERLTRMGFDIIGGTPENFGRHLRAELAKWAKVINATGLKAE
jgi:tripartite-type tricarboxylate transporter receptor subunit TctC